MRIKFLQGALYLNRWYTAGSVVEVDDYSARLRVKAGTAVEARDEPICEKTEAKTEVEKRETASAKPKIEKR